MPDAEIFEIRFNDGFEQKALSVLRGSLPPGIREHLRATPMAQDVHWTADDIRVQRVFDPDLKGFIWTAAAAVFVEETTPERVVLNVAKVDPVTRTAVGREDREFVIEKPEA